VNRKRLGLVAVMLIISLAALVYLNIHYDVLARYPYQEITAEQKELIVSRLDQQGIDYIIDHAIEPGLFLPFISYPSFSIYNLEFYNPIHEIFPIDDVDLLLRVCNQAKNKEWSVDELILYLEDYHFDELEFYFLYHGDLPLIQKPTAFGLTLTSATIANYSPKDLTELKYPDDEGSYLSLRQPVAAALDELCAALDEEFKSSGCGQLVIIQAYTSYQQLLVSDSRSTYFQAGQSPFQLGDTLSFTFKSKKEEKTEWMLNKGNDYGFIGLYDPEGNLVGLRYTGVDSSGATRPKRGQLS